MFTHRHSMSLVLVSASIAHAQSTSYYEASKDGHHFAVTSDEPSFAQRGAGVPFGAAPDQQVDIRRQVGGLKIADINGDGINDLVAVCYISNSFPPYDSA
ncbi:MAG: hypothetical protein NXI07_15210, partial [bacterium]|nr:hypothetical protein [bacterium]